MRQGARGSGPGAPELGSAVHRRPNHRADAVEGHARVLRAPDHRFELFEQSLTGKLECGPAPLLLGFILGPMMEENLRRALLLSRGDPTVFFTRPLSLGMLVAAGLLLLIIVLPAVRKTREEAFQEEGA